MDFQKILQLEGLQVGQLERIHRINRLYDLYEGKQHWATKEGLDYKPTKKITNYIKKLIDKRARFMFGKEPFFNLSGDDEDRTQQKEDLLKRILDENKFHSKLLKAKKDCAIGGKVALRLWAEKNAGIKLYFIPAQEFIETYSIEDTDNLERIVLFYTLKEDVDKSKQRVKKQEWTLVNGKCMLNEGIYDGNGNVVEIVYKDYYNGLDYIPIIIIQNGGLTGDTRGYSDVEMLWDNQDSYNKLTSDDQDALKFQMFGQSVFTDAAPEALESIVIAPGAMIDLQTDQTQAMDGRQAKAERLESNFVYGEKYTDTINRIKSDMFSLMDVPDTSLEQLKGMMASGKSMESVYWDLMETCNEAWTEWEPALRQMVDYIFHMIEVYSLYHAKDVAMVETTLNIERYYPILKNENEQRKMDLEEVISGVRSKRSYLDKWSEVEDIDKELKWIAEDSGEAFSVNEDEE